MEICHLLAIPPFLVSALINRLSTVECLILVDDLFVILFINFLQQKYFFTNLELCEKYFLKTIVYVCIAHFSELIRVRKRIIKVRQKESLYAIKIYRIER